MPADTTVPPRTPDPRAHTACPPGKLPQGVRVVLACLVALVAVTGGCARAPEGRLLFCESITADNQPVGEADTFSPGTVSMLVAFDRPVHADALVVHIDRLEGTRRTAYGDDVHLRVTPDAGMLRLDHVVSFADAGEYLVQILTRERQSLAEGRITIVSAK